VFRRDPEPEPQPRQPEPEPALNPLPVAFQGKAARARRWPPLDRRAMPPRLVAFGTTTRYVKSDRRGQPDRVFEIESAYEADNPSSIWWRHVGENEEWHRHNDGDNRKTNEVLERFTVRTRDPNRQETGKADVVTRFEPITPEQRAAAEVMRGILGGR
jgi:hypothetical protein